MVYFANCHLHSDISDSFHSPEAIVDIAKEIGHKALILTDHDTVRERTALTLPAAAREYTRCAESSSSQRGSVRAFTSSVMILTPSIPLCAS